VSTGEFWSWPFVKIMPFEPLIRAASSEEQFALHQSLDYLRKKGSGNINKKMKMALKLFVKDSFILRTVTKSKY